MKVSPMLYTGLPENTQMLVITKRVETNPLRIMEAVVEHLELTLHDLISSSRKRSLVEARCILVGLILQVDPNYGLKKLGELIGGKHHSSVIHMRDTFDNLYLTDKPFTKKVREVLKYV